MKNMLIPRKVKSVDESKQSSNSQEDNSNEDCYKTRKLKNCQKTQGPEGVEIYCKVSRRMYLHLIGQQRKQIIDYYIINNRLGRTGKRFDRMNQLNATRFSWKRQDGYFLNEFSCKLGWRLLHFFVILMAAQTEPSLIHRKYYTSNKAFWLAECNYWLSSLSQSCNN